MVRDPIILVIDDEVEICSFLKDLLSAEGYAVLTESDPERGLRLIGRMRPDLVILDLKMPEMDGIEVLRRIKKVDATITVIIATGYGTMDSAKAAMRLGAYDYVTKPFDLAHLKALVKDALTYQISGFVEETKAQRRPLSDEERAFLDALGTCRPEGACVWEAAVRAFLLGDSQFMNDWMEQANIPQKDKENLRRLIQILSDVIRRARREEES